MTKKIIEYHMLTRWGGDFLLVNETVEVPENASEETILDRIKDDAADKVRFEWWDGDERGAS